MLGVDRAVSMAPTEILCLTAVAPLTSHALFLLHISKNMSPLHKFNAPFTDSFGSLFQSQLFSLYESLLQHQILFSCALLFFNRQINNSPWLTLPVSCHPSLSTCSRRTGGWSISVQHSALHEEQRQWGQAQKIGRGKPSSWAAQDRTVTQFFKCIQHFIAVKHVVPHKWLKHYRAAAWPGEHVFMVTP